MSVTIERSTIPYSYLHKIVLRYPVMAWRDILSKLVKDVLPPKWGQIKGGKASVKNLILYNALPIKLPKLDDTRFAEFIGIMLGDGHLSQTGINITLEYPAELEYKRYIEQLLFYLFERKPLIKKQQKIKAIHLVINSKNLVKFLNSIGLNTGNKILNGAKIPAFIMQDQKLLRWCIRGLVDTDGGIFHKQKGYSRCIIEFTNNSKPLLQTFKQSLLLLGFHTSNSGGRLKDRAIRIQAQNEVKKYVEEVGFSNTKNILRYQQFNKYGYVPKREELDVMLNAGVV